LDGATLDGVVAELRPRLVGQYLGRVRAAAAHALTVELGRERLWCDATRETAGLYLLPRDEARALADEDAAAGRTRQAVLLARKHLDGARVTGLHRVAGTRTVVLEAGRTTVVLRLSGSAPALTLALDGEPLATMGEGPPEWPPPAPQPEREWDRIDPARWRAEVEQARAAGWSEVRAHIAACPALGPSLARLLASGAIGFEELRARLGAARPTLVAPAALDRVEDAALAERGSVRLLPFAPPGAAAEVIPYATWTAAAAAYLAARVRGRRFADAQRRALDEARHRVRRLEQLRARLHEDRAGLPGAAELRHRAEALLAAATAAPLPDEGHVEVPDPYDPQRRLRVAVDPRLTLPVNADRLFAKARRVDRAARHLEERLAQAGRDLARAREDEARAQSARALAALASAPSRPRRPSPDAAAGPRRYLTSRGLEILAGRGARENQQVTFEAAAPEDWWLHARDVPGAHVVLRDPQGRAADEDLREAAEVAAFFSEARAEAQADVHVTRRKHVRAAGGAGRVRVGHSETLRVTPRDPEGRLRRRL
jgi:predicted ribosome quality control (RQC) complex YloA/Tae2 family protein